MGLAEQLERYRELGLDPGDVPGLAAIARDEDVLILPDTPAQALTALPDGIIDMRPVGPEVFRPITPVPETPYLLRGLDRGSRFRDVAPRDAVQVLVDEGRLPLTLTEGVALLLLEPGMLSDGNAIQMPGSRDSSKRIPSLWRTKQRRTRLGWCFAGVPHSWMGVASAEARIAAN